MREKLRFRKHESVKSANDSIFNELTQWDGEGGQFQALSGNPKWANGHVHQSIFYVLHGGRVVAGKWVQSSILHISYSEENWQLTNKENMKNPKKT